MSRFPARAMWRGATHGDGDDVGVLCSGGTKTAWDAIYVIRLVLLKKIIEKYLITLISIIELHTGPQALGPLFFLTESVTLLTLILWLPTIIRKQYYYTM